MSKIVLEHVNVTVTDAIRSAELLCKLFDWKIRWQGPALDNGYTTHVGDGDGDGDGGDGVGVGGSYVAFYAPARELGEKPREYTQRATLSHIGVVVEDIDAIEQRVLAEGFKPHSHQEYEPGKRFYFNDQDGVEYEVVSYAK